MRLLLARQPSWRAALAARRHPHLGRRVENARLKKLLAEAELDKAMLKELAEGNF